VKLGIFGAFCVLLFLIVARRTRAAVLGQHGRSRHALLFLIFSTASEIEAEVQELLGDGLLLG